MKKLEHLTLSNYEQNNEGLNTEKERGVADEDINRE